MNILTRISDLFFPPQCIFCEKTLKLSQRPLICAECIDMHITNEIKCPKCGGKVHLNDDLLPVCETCKIAGRYYDGATYAFEYHENVKNAIHQYKFSRQIYIGDQFAAVLARKLRDAGINRLGVDAVIAVPGDRKRNSTRGFDAAGLLAETVAKELHIPYDENCVVRVKEIQRQSSLSYTKRQENVRAAFKVISPELVRGKRLLLIDDIITTGATVTEISRVLKRAGAAYIFVASAARKSKSVMMQKPDGDN